MVVSEMAGEVNVRVKSAEGFEVLVPRAISRYRVLENGVEVARASFGSRWRRVRRNPQQVNWVLITD